MKKILVEAIKFVGISGVGWIIDICIYLTLTYIIKCNVFLANVTSSLVGVTFVFIVSTRKLFKNNSKINLKIKYIIYVIYQILLIITASKIMLIISDTLKETNINIILNYINIIVKIIITPFTLLINYIVMKYLIEKI